MGDHFPAREFGWTESSGSEISVGPFVEEFDASSQKSEGSEVPFSKHGPVLEADVKNLHIKQDFWSHCAIGFILDFKNSPYIISNK